MKNGAPKAPKGPPLDLGRGPLTLPEPMPLPEELYPQREDALEDREDEASLVELDRLRQKVMQASGGQKLRMLLDAPAPGALIRRMPAQEFLITVKDIGKADCAELVELADEEQVSLCLDLDCWKKDKIDLSEVYDWLSYITAGEFGAAEKILKSLDVELLVFLSMELFRVYYRVDEDWPTESPGDIIEMSDTHYIIEIPFSAEDPRSTLAHGILHLFRQYGYEFYQRMFEWSRWGQRSDLEEIAYQFRKARIEDHGFIDYFDAIGIYQPLMPKAKPPEVVFAPPPADEVLPILSTGAPRQDGLFGKAVARLEDEALKARLQRELLFLTNKVLCADQVDPGYVPGIRQTTRNVQRTLDLGLETLAGHDIDEAARVLAAHSLEWVFKNGFTALARLRKKAHRIARDERLSLDPQRPLSLLPSPFFEVLQGLRQLKPRYHMRLDQPPGTKVRPFRNLADVERTKACLETAALLAPLFFDEFGFSFDALKGWTQDGLLASPEHPEDIDFSHLFLTALGHFVLEGSFVLEPLRVEQVQALLGRLFVAQNPPPHSLDEGLKAQVEAELLKRPDTSAAQAQGLQDFLAGVWLQLQDQAAFLPLDQAPDPRFLNLFLIAR